MRSSIGVAVALVGGLRLGTPLYALAAGIGAMSTGYVSMRGVYRTRANAMLATAVAMALAAYVSASAGRSTIAIVAVVAAIAYAYGLLSCLGDAASAIGLNALISSVILGSIGTPVPEIAPVAGFVLAGGLVQTALLIVAWPVGRHGAERRALADAYRSLARYARGLHDGSQDSLPAHDPLLAVRAALSDPQPFGRRGELFAMQTLADEAARIRGTLTLIAAEPGDDAPELAAAAAQLLDAVAEALEEARAPRDDGAWQRAGAAPRDRALWQRLFGQIRAAWRGAALPAGGGRTAVIDRSFVPHPERWWPVVRANAGLGSPFGRHALRLSIALAAAMLLYRLTHLERGYWVALTCVIVMRPDYTSTLTRGFARIGGTIVGALIASAIGLALHVTPRLDVGLAIACAALGYLTFPLNYALYSVTLTAYVVFILSMIG
ncbi:MAG TPA: FUSC family protein, partial [Candidatus Acidoferrales bacterium]|nr:FUSC family protein [Candidatus Acidoferrales bacterium]